MKKLIWVILLFFTAGSAWSQSSSLFPDPILEKRAEFILSAYEYEKDLNIHTSIRPYSVSELKSLLTENDSSQIELTGYSGKSGFLNKVKLMPLLNTFGGYGSLDSSSTGLLGGVHFGLGIQSDINEKWSVYGDFLFGDESLPKYIGDYADNKFVVPSVGRAFKSGIGHSYLNWNARIAYQPSKIFNIELGQGKNFIGEGHRSLMLSDQGVNYPFLKVSTKFWKVKYVNLWMALKDVSSSFGNPEDYRNKFVSAHYLSWNITDDLNFGIFESIVWMGNDTLLNRGFDLNYLNPIIFFRPVEYSIGSTDNALLGGSLSYKLGKGKLYSQVMLDEFLLDSLKSNGGWWANKFGVQMGYKHFDLFNISGLYFQGEFNMVRPFTYSHGNVTQNYGHFNQSLAHPLGANFYETLIKVGIYKEKYILENQFSYMIHGADKDSLGYGGDIFKSYNSNRAKDVGNFIGQGIKNKVVYNSLKYSKLVSDKMGIWAFANLQSRYMSSELGSKLDHYLYIGIRTSFYRQYRDF